MVDMLSCLTVSTKTSEIAIVLIKAELIKTAANAGFMKVEPNQPTTGGECNVGIWKYGNGRIDELTN